MEMYRPQPVSPTEVPVALELDTQVEAQTRTNTSTAANRLTLPFHASLELVNEDPVDSATVADSVPVELPPEDIGHYSGDMYLFSEPQYSAFNPNNDAPMPNRAPQLLARIGSLPLAYIPPAEAGEDIDTQAYTAFVRNSALITENVASQFVGGIDPTVYTRLTQQTDTFRESYEVHKHLA
jgi:hypothetical protein